MMKRWFAAIALVAVVGGTAFASGQDDRPESFGRGYGRSASEAPRTEYAESHALVLDGFELGDLSDAEAEALLYMREEEKLARDVYSALYEVWNFPVFANIARSEQQHMDSVLTLLDRYELEDPAANDVPGSFVSAPLASLYGELVEAGRASLVGALTVGATIEDLDMADLLRHIEETDNEEIALVYESLLAASENHMRAFAAQLERLNVAYEAVYVSDEYLASVLAGGTAAPGAGDRVARGGGRGRAF